MPRSLRPTTIIPPHLYVERSADRQLNNIIEEMGRPGYVLVARQMGKTNLLINMKRRREAKGDLVVYFDLSNRFANARALFRFIIDSILEADPKLRNSLSSNILGQRALEEIEPNLEYDRHLRQILREAKDRRIIIVLDEIDSLISVPYSDTVFAQIRSMYFSRINHPEYQNLTYALSGVAEPTDLIKDKNISPFNIGEKIYLDDFTFVEFKTLLANASVAFSHVVIEEIYSWTTGSPRMTWDICAELEDVELGGRSVTQGDVTSAVQKLYLTRFDRAPIDHIRVLVESDPLLSSAISSIRWGKGDILDERTKGRLYLAGISSVSNSNPAIKNKIIDAALSDSWLEQISASQKTLLELAKDNFEADQYKEAIQNYQDHIRKQPDGAELDFSHLFRLAVSQYHESMFEEAIVNFSKATNSKQAEELLPTLKFYIGSSMMKIRRFSDAITEFEEVVDKTNPIQNSVRLGLTSSYFSADPARNMEKIEKIGDAIIAELATEHGGPAKDERDREILASTYFNLAQTHAVNRNFDTANKFREYALSAAPSEFKPTILLVAGSDSRTADEMADNAKLAAETIIDEKLAFIPNSLSSLSFNEITLARTLLHLHRGGRTEAFDRLLSYATQTLYSHTRRPFSILLHLLQISDDAASLAPLLWVAIENYQDETVLPRHRLEALRLATSYADAQRKGSAFESYCAALEQLIYRGEEASEDDVITLVNSAYNQLSSRNYQSALKSIKLGRAITEQNLTRYAFHNVLLIRHEVDVYRILRDLDRAKSLARLLLQRLDEKGLDFELPGELDVKGVLDSFRQYATRLLFDPKDDPFAKLRRNQVVTVEDQKTGQARKSKFKFVEKELREGSLVLISVESK
jgi:tetratricopeptide (TPR) repeat protein